MVTHLIFVHVSIKMLYICIKHLNAREEKSQKLIFN